MIPKTPKITLVRLSAKITIAINTLNILSTSPIFAFITLIFTKVTLYSDVNNSSKYNLC